MCTPENPSFTINKWGLRASKLYRHVFVIFCLLCLLVILVGYDSKVFYSFINITLPLLRIFGEHSSVSPMLFWKIFNSRGT